MLEVFEREDWNDLVDFEVYPVISSKEAAEKISSRT
jgi:hypothetical protein